VIKISCFAAVLFRVGRQGTKDILKEKILRDYSLNWRGMHLKKTNLNMKTRLFIPEGSLYFL